MFDKSSMKFCRYFLLLFILGKLLFPAFGQEYHVEISGKTIGADQHPVSGVSIRVKNSRIGTYSDFNGKFKMKIKSGSDSVLIFSRVDYETVELPIARKSTGDIILIMKPSNINLSEVQVFRQRKTRNSSVNIDPLLSKSVANAGSGGIEQLVKTMPGVGSNTELSPQYNVRGGNYDENLLYVNGIEIFRPFLVKTGEQEGLSFLNPDLVSAIRFSTGGFDSSYGDKMSSVLDIDYKVPEKFAGTAELGALGASAHLEGRVLKDKFTYLTGIRYRDNRYLLGTLQQRGHYAPAFFDVQALLGYEFSPRFSLNFLGNISTNNFTFTPETRETRFGTMNQSYLLKIYFEGNEKDRFTNRFGALSASYHPNKNLNLQLNASSFYADEKERSDILGQYYLNEIISGIDPQTSPDSTMLLGVGSSLLHVGNFLHSNIVNIEHRGKYNQGNHLIQWGVKYQSERIHDQVTEWQMRDSAGYSLPNLDQNIDLYSSIRADNHLESRRYSAFVQDNFSTHLQNSTLSFSVGGRLQYWDFNQQTIFSPRLSVVYLPAKFKSVQLHAAWGIYQQMPFFKELKNRRAEIIPTVRAQKSTHYLLGIDYQFLWDNRPLKFTTEIYYKSLSNLIPYKITNLDIQYFPEYQSKGYATGLEFKLLGELVPGVTSWASMSLMKTEEDIIGDQYLKPATNGQPAQVIYPGYLPRPTDQRFNFSLFFQDYLPNNPTVKMNLTLLYGSGLPFGPPGVDRHLDVFRMPSYRRVDLGVSKIVVGSQTRGKSNFLSKNLKEVWISLELFNLFDLDNTISHYWVSDYQNQMHAVPNYLTGRRINLKASVSF
jgi:hypothetical protein